MTVTTATDLATFPTSLHNSPTLLPEHIASLVTAVSLAARVSLRCSSLFVEASLEAAKYGIVLSLGVSRQALANALATAKQIHMLTYPESSDADMDEEKRGFLRILDKYTSLGIYIIHHTFTLAELFALSGLQLTSQTVKSGFKTAEESVRIIDGIFGSNETSRAIASIITLVHRELALDPDFVLAKGGKVSVLAGLTKALTAFAVLQYVTHKRTMKQVKSTVLWQGLVVDEETDNQLVHYESNDDAANDRHVHILNELQAFLSGSKRDTDEGDMSDGDPKNVSYALVKEQDKDESEPFAVYEITTSTKRTTTTTTRIRPVTPSGGSSSKSKYIVVQSDEADTESFVAMVGSSQDDANNLPTYPLALTSAEQQYPTNVRMGRQEPGGRNVILSTMSQRVSQKKVERQEQYASDDALPMPLNQDDTDMPSGMTTMTSTSTTMQSTTAATQYTEALSDETSNHATTKRPSTTWTLHPAHQLTTNVFRNSHPSSPSPSTSTSTHRKKKHRSLPARAEPHQRRSSTSSAAIPSMTPLDADNQEARPRLYRSNSVASTTSVSSVSKTFTTTTYSTTPIPTPSSSTRLTPSHSSHDLPDQTSLPLLPPPALDHSVSLSTIATHAFPRNHLIHNIARFMRYASAAYGESFMRILGIGDIPSVLPSSRHHHPNHHVFAHHTGLSVQDILLSSYTDRSLLTMHHPSIHELVHYVTVDHAAQAIVLTCRGTLGLSDVLTDLTCEYADVTLDHPPKGVYKAHAGMLEAAQMLARTRGKVFRAIQEGLMQYPNYGLVLCGHSLGGGVASLLGLIWSTRCEDSRYPFVTSSASGLPAGRPIHCFVYGPPSVMSLDLSVYCTGLVTSVVHRDDFVSCLSLGLLQDFKNVAITLHDESRVAEEILHRIVRRFRNPRPAKANDAEADEDEQWFWALIKTMRADMRTDKLYPPSTVYLLESAPQLTQHRQSARETAHSATRESRHTHAHVVTLRRCDDIQSRFSEILFSRSMFMDHSPNMYEKAVRLLCRGYFGQYRAYENL